MCPSHTRTCTKACKHTHMQIRVKPVCEVLQKSVLIETNSNSLCFYVCTYISTTHASNNELIIDG